jgi:hypothetical protein
MRRRSSRLETSHPHGMPTDQHRQLTAPVRDALEHLSYTVDGVSLPSRCPRCEELEDLVAALKGTVGYSWALWQQVQGVLARLPAPRRPGSPYARWYDGPRADALRGYHPDVAPEWCSACSRPMLALFELPRRYGRAAPVCSACSLELVGRSALVPWRDPVGE